MTLNEIFLASEYIHVFLQLSVRDAQRDIEPAKRLNAKSKRFWVDSNHQPLG